MLLLWLRLGDIEIIPICLRRIEQRLTKLILILRCDNLGPVHMMIRMKLGLGRRLSLVLRLIGNWGVWMVLSTCTIVEIEGC
jgi:hypothetical protein